MALGLFIFAPHLGGILRIGTRKSSPQGLQMRNYQTKPISSGPSAAQLSVTIN